MALVFSSRKFWRFLIFLITPRRAGLLRASVAFIFVLIFLVIIRNLISILKTVGYIESYDVISLNPEYSNDPKVRDAVLSAYGNGWVGFPDLQDAPCKRALTKPRVRNAWYPNVPVQQIPNNQFAEDGFDCSEFRRKYGYERYPAASEEELNFPIAFIILFHKDFHQVHLLLRAIYRPHNVYCLHPDAKSDYNLLEAVQATASCLPNVFVTRHLEDVTYKGFSRLMADINCMRDLMRQKVQWRYVINMPGQQFPLRTNLEMVRILSNFYGANDIEGMTGLQAIPSRYKKKYILARSNKTGQIEMFKSNINHPAPPHGLRVVKGSAYNTFSKAFVRFVLTDRKTQDLLQWTKDILSPDEYFWAMVNHNPILKAPGGYNGFPQGKPHLTVFAIWENENPCATMFVREICILSPADLPLLLGRPELFANKLYMGHHPSALHCLDQMVFNRTITGYVGHMDCCRHLKFALPQDTF